MQNVLTQNQIYKYRIAGWHARMCMRKTMNRCKTNGYFCMCISVRIEKTVKMNNPCAYLYLYI